jgi:hypothetical protein
MSTPARAEDSDDGGRDQGRLGAGTPVEPAAIRQHGCGDGKTGEAPQDVRLGVSAVTAAPEAVDRGLRELDGQGQRHNADEYRQELPHRQKRTEPERHRHGEVPQALCGVKRLHEVVVHDALAAGCTAVHERDTEYAGDRGGKTSPPQAVRVA